MNLVSCLYVCVVHLKQKITVFMAEKEEVREEDMERGEKKEGKLERC